MPKEQTLLRMFKLNPVLLFLIIGYPFFRHPRIDLYFLTGVAYVFFFFLFPSVHDYYFILAAPFLAIVSMHTLFRLMQLLGLSPAALLILLAGGLAVYSSYNLGKARQSVAHSAIPQAPQMAEALEKAGPTDKKIFGQGEIASLLALLSQRRILLNHVDTNGQVYRSGKDNLQDVTQALVEGESTALVTKEKRIDEQTSIFFGPMVDVGFREYVLRNFAPVQVYLSAHDPGERIIIFAKKSSGLPAY